jgi:hypothetical protein
LLATSAIMLCEKKTRKRKMWSKKWYLKRNISWDGHLLNELLETDVPWDDAIVVSADKLRELMGFSEWTAKFSVWKTAGKDSSEACAIACQNCAVYSVCPSGVTSHSKIAHFNCEYIGRLWQGTVQSHQQRSISCRRTFVYFRKGKYWPHIAWLIVEPDACSSEPIW